MLVQRRGFGVLPSVRCLTLQSKYPRCRPLASTNRPYCVPYMTLSEAFLWALWLSPMSTGFMQYKETTFVYIGCFGMPRFVGCMCMMRRNSSRICFDRGRSSRFHSHIGGSHSSNHFCVIADLRSHFLSCT